MMGPRESHRVSGAVKVLPGPGTQFVSISYQVTQAPRRARPPAPRVRTTAPIKLPWPGDT
eukprot:648446-Hanusia_phi.AAC.2